MKTPNELKNDWKQYTREYIKNVEKYQQQCKHNISEWLNMIDAYQHCNDTGWKVKQCMDCWLILQEKDRSGTVKDYRTSTLKYGDYWKWSLERFTRNEKDTKINE